MHESLSGYPVVIEIPVAWGEMDSFQHVNNVVYFRYFENARIAYFERICYRDILEETGIGPILAATSCQFKFPITYPDTLWVGARVTSLAEDRFAMQYLAVSQQHQRRAAVGDGLVVAFDYRKSQKAPLPALWRARIEALQGEALQT